MGAFWGYFLDFFGVHEPEEERRTVTSRREADPRDRGHAREEPDPRPVTPPAPSSGGRQERVLR
ncbi:MAG: hypothetical protein ACK47B_25675 [Armatimonadota bacterium]